MEPLSILIVGTLVGVGSASAASPAQPVADMVPVSGATAEAPPNFSDVNSVTAAIDRQIAQFLHQAVIPRSQIMTQCAARRHTIQDQAMMGHYDERLGRIAWESCHSLAFGGTSG